MVEIRKSYVRVCRGIRDARICITGRLFILSDFYSTAKGLVYSMEYKSKVEVAALLELHKLPMNLLSHIWRSQ